MPLHLIPGRPAAGTYRVLLRGDGKHQPVISPPVWRVVGRLWGRATLGVARPSRETAPLPVGCPVRGDRFAGSGYIWTRDVRFHYPPDSLSSCVWSEGVRRPRLQEERRISTQIPLSAAPATAACLQGSMVSTGDRVLHTVVHKNSRGLPLVVRWSLGKHQGR